MQFSKGIKIPMSMRFLQDMGIDIQSDIFFAHHDLGDYVEDLIVASAASRGAVGYFLYAFKSFEDIFKLIVFVKCLYDIEQADFLAVADHEIFFHSDDRSFLLCMQVFPMNRVG